ncbi:MAG: URC4/urg3 family protein [Alphaproteobacteria bacterium]|nr:URC4/urg3 family protein [Alphaproteobacteria bacterium]
MTPEAIRSRCGELLAAADRDELAHFSLRRDRLPACADYVLQTIRANYPTLEIPFHARWRHFVVGGEDRWSGFAAQQNWDRLEQARVAFDLAVTSVLLDAGAGPKWSYTDNTGQETQRSEGLAIASLESFAAGLFSADKDRPWRADAEGLAQLSVDDLAQAFQVTVGNPLAGLEGRVSLLRSLGQALASQPERFGQEGRIGNLVNVLAARGNRVEARTILLSVLECFGGIWPGRSELAGQNLGDTWTHSKISADDGLVPFHKLSQWLSYSLIEPLQEAGLQVDDIDGLTGLAEYRNGGLLIDLGVLQPQRAAITEDLLQPDDEAIVEWRALTVTLLDELAGLIRSELNVSADEFPLAKVLEGGTWAAGRRIAAELRPGGGPPVNIVSDGSVF